MEEQNTNAVDRKKRPTFLTVLCILSFIGVGIAVISNIIGYLGLAAATSMATEMAGAFDGAGEFGDTIAGAAAAAVKNAKISIIVNIIGALVVLIGVIMMWKLKKKGYFIYVIGELAPPIAGIILLGFSGAMAGGFMATATLFFPVLFVILYGLNVKHMS